MDGFHGSVDFMVKETEKLHARVGRYKSPDEHPFFLDDLPDPMLPPLQYPQVLHPIADAININNKIWDMHFRDLLTRLVREGDDGNCGSAAVCDTICLQDRTRLMDLLTYPTVEEAIKSSVTTRNMTFCKTNEVQREAEKASWNYIGIFKISNITGKRLELVPSKSTGNDSDMDSDSSDSDEEDKGEDGGSGAPVLQLRKVAHEGCVNRIRAMPQTPHICASWADTGHVQVWDFSSHLNALAESETDASWGPSNETPLFKFGGHKDEGYAIDWSPLVSGRLVTGDCKNCIHLWEPTSGTTWKVDANPFVGHTGSVEDLQWSPTEPYVFASCSVDGNIAIWDIRLGKSPAASIKAHNVDVNVISWNRQL